MRKTFTPNPIRSVIIHSGDRDYTLRFPCGREIGGSSRAALERYSRSQGFTPDYQDERREAMKVTHGL